MPPTDRAPKTQEQRREESEREVLKAAMVCFARHGYVKTTMNSVAKEAGYTAGLVSHKFGSKEGLLQAVVDRISHRFLHDQLGTAIERESAAESISNYISIYLREVSLREGPMRALYVIMGEALGAVPEIRKSIADLNEAARERLKSMILKGVERGEFRADVDADAAAALIIGALRGLVMQHLVDPRRVSLSRMQQTMQATVLGSLAA